jgi:hypothetical protein
MASHNGFRFRASRVVSLSRGLSTYTVPMTDATSTLALLVCGAPGGLLKVPRIGWPGHYLGAGAYLPYHRPLYLSTFRAARMASKRLKGRQAPD